MKIARERVNVAGTIREARRMPCICPKQFEVDATKILTTSSSESRGYVIERVECQSCFRAWSRINCP